MITSMVTTAENELQKKVFTRGKERNTTWLLDLFIFNFSRKTRMSNCTIVYYSSDCLGLGCRRWLKSIKKGMCYYFFSCIQVKIACDLSFCQATTVIVAAWWLGRSIIIIIIMIACYEAFNLFSIEEWDCWDYLHCVM